MTLVRGTFGRRQVAVHESAHAVTAVVRGLPFRHIELRIDLRSAALGALHWRGDDCPVIDDLPSRVHDAAVVLLAGGQAEVLAFGTAVHDSDDVRVARAGLALALDASMSSEVVEAALVRCRREAADCVAAHWDWILATASALRARRTLFPHDIEALRTEGRPE